MRYLWICLLVLLNCGTTNQNKAYQAKVRPSLEDRLPNGALYTPGTQSFLRERHWLEGVTGLNLFVYQDLTAHVRFKRPDSEYRLSLANFPMDHLVPRLHYQVQGQGDDFDALNLMLAEYSRNSISVPRGKAGDEMGYFESNLLETHPWQLAGDYQFKPEPNVLPVRVGLVNNCLRPGLWEISATDRSGEIYHGWFDMPMDLYLGLVSKVNGLDESFVDEALKWRVTEVKLDLSRLRDAKGEMTKTSLGLHQEELARGFSSQDSRRKLAKGFAQVKDETWQKPATLESLTSKPARLTEFVEPGKYRLESYREFDLRFLRNVAYAEIGPVTPKTSYGMDGKTAEGLDYVEMRLHLDGHVIILGNLPLQLMVPQEDYTIHGFGVGVLSSSDFAERRAYLFSEGPAPSYAYLAVPEGEDLLALNSHERGIEQVFIRTHLYGEEEPWWEITITSYERIVDLIKYKVVIPEHLRETARKSALHYISPKYLTYRDDNLR